MPYRCSLKWCPQCLPGLSYKRQRKMKVWASLVTQPKHVVVTARNTETLTLQTVRRFQKALRSLRRSKLFAKATGGCASMEITNEQRGWHLHAHMLVNTRWLDEKKLAVAWAKRIGQDFAIVKVKDARGTAYTREVAKYVAKGNAIASWSANEILAFVTAFNGVRTFTTFGNLRKAKDYVEKATAKNPFKCDECSSTEGVMVTERSQILWQERHRRRR